MMKVDKKDKLSWPDFRKYTEKLTSEYCEINQNQIVFQVFFNLLMSRNHLYLRALTN